MILAAGRGERMRPLTDHTPKPLLLVAGKPLIIWHIENLSSAGYKNIVINHAYLGYQIEDALGSGKQWGVNIQYSPEGEGNALETGGGIFKALPLLGEAPFLVVNGDVWCDFDFSSIALSDDDLAHLVLVNNPAHNENGDFALKDGRVFQEGSERFTFSGIGAYSSTLFSNSEPGAFPLAPMLRGAMDQSRVSGELHRGEWIDVGTPQRLAQLDNALSST